MDPDVALTTARSALALVRAGEGTRADHVSALEDLADAFEALDGWITKAGYLPVPWQHGAQ